MQLITYEKNSKPVLYYFATLHMVDFNKIIFNTNHISNPSRYIKVLRNLLI